jgi:hypothetical protein
VPLTFAVTWDYRCPFARNAHDLVVEALRAGADWDVTFVPFSLGQVHVADGDPDVWDAPERDSGLLALQVGVAVRDRHPERFLDVHQALFDARHAHGRQIRDEAVVRDVLRTAGLDADEVLAEVDGGRPLETVRKEHEAAVTGHDVWGVPTFIAGERAVFVRLMSPSGGDGASARTTVERVVALLQGWPDLNEFKHTTLSR